MSKGQISIWHISLILKLALYKYNIIITLLVLVAEGGRTSAVMVLTDFGRYLPAPSCKELTHYGLVTPYDVIDLDEHGFR